MTSRNSLTHFAGLLTTIVLMLPAHSIGASNLVCESLFVGGIRAHRTVKIIEITRNANGEEFFVLQRTPEEDSWSSLYSPRGFDRQGNPLSGFTILGHDLATVLGYGESPSGELSVPVPHTFNRRVARFNLYLRSQGVEPIRVSLYEQPVATIVTYLNSWARSAAVPVAAGQTNHTVHDISFHYPNILLPSDVARLIQIQASIATKWLEFSGLGSASGASRNIVSKIDRLSTSANFTMGMISKKGLAAQFAEHFDLRISAASQMSPFPTAELEDQLRIHFESTSPITMFTRIVAKYENLPTDKFVAWAQEEYPEWSRSLANQGFKDLNSLHEKYVNRATELRAAAREFLKN